MRTILTAALAVAFFEVGAQPPVPPVPPVTPALPAPAARPATPAPPDLPPPPARPAPLGERPWMTTPGVGDLWHGTDIRPLDFDFSFDREWRIAELDHARELMRFDRDEMRVAAEALRSIDHAAIRDESMRAMELSRAHIEDARLMADHDLRFALGDLGHRPPQFNFDGFSAFGERGGRAPTLHVTPREPWLPQDPADSLYRAARDLLNRSQYRNAAETFRVISSRFPSSGYAPEALYFQAYSLYKIGGQNELRQALSLLDQQKAKFPNANVPDPALPTRIRGELASQGDARAAEAVASTAARQGQSCNRDDMAVRLEALNALSRMNIDSTTPILRRVLSRRDECSISLRRQAITLMAKSPDANTTDIVIDVLKNDPAPEVRRAALSWLGEVPSERGAAALDEVLRSPKDEELHSSALSALASSRNPRAVQALRTVIERKDVSEGLRRTAMSRLASVDSVNAGQFLRTLYPKLESPRLQEAALSQIARLRGDDNQKWMLGFVRDTTQPVRLRTTALSYLTRSPTTSIADVGGLYKNVPEFELKQAIITSLSSRKEPEAVDQLILIYHASTDAKLKIRIIDVLSRRDDPRTKQLVLDILNKS